MSLTTDGVETKATMNAESYIARHVFDMTFVPIGNRICICCHQKTYSYLRVLC